MDLDFEKMNGLVPAIIQDNYTQKVLMLGFMNEEAYNKTVETGKVTFFSRTKNTVPSLPVDSTSIVPRCASTISRAMAKPRPLPWERFPV